MLVKPFIQQAVLAGDNGSWLPSGRFFAYLIMNFPAVLFLLLAAWSGAPLAGSEVSIVAFGDSTTAHRPGLTVYADLLPPRLTADCGVTVKVINAGVPGNTTEDARRRFPADVLERQPDLVIIQFGINDSTMDVWKEPSVTHTRVAKKEYRKNLEYFVTEIRRQHGQVMLMTPNPLQWAEKMRLRYGKLPYHVDDSDGFNVTLRPFAQEMRQVASELGVPLLDVMAAFDDAWRKDPGRELLSDGVHPNQAGHQLVTDLLLAFLRDRPQLLEAKSAKK